MSTPYRTSPEPLPAATPVPWRCRWFGHRTSGPIIPVPNTDPLVLLQKCGRGVYGERGDASRCEKWRRLDFYTGDGTETGWLELHEVWPDTRDKIETDPALDQDVTP